MQETNAEERKKSCYDCGNFNQQCNSDARKKIFENQLRKLYSETEL